MSKTGCFIGKTWIPVYSRENPGGYARGYRRKIQLKSYFPARIPDEGQRHSYVSVAAALLLGQHLAKRSGAPPLRPPGQKGSYPMPVSLGIPVHGAGGLGPTHPHGLPRALAKEAAFITTSRVTATLAELREVRGRCRPCPQPGTLTEPERPPTLKSTVCTRYQVSGRRVRGSGWDCSKS